MPLPLVSDAFWSQVAPLLPPEPPKPRGRYGVLCRIARRGVESSEKLGRHRWVVERTLAWLNRFRRLTVRYERRADIHRAFLLLACSLICRRFVERDLA